MRRSRVVSIVAAAAVMLAIAVPVALLVGDKSSPGDTHLPVETRTSGPYQPDPQQAAIRTAETIIATAPMLQGAKRIDRAPLAALEQPDEVPGAQLVQRTAFWTASGAVDATIGYLRSHPPNRMRLSGSGSGHGPGMPDSEMLSFDADALRSLQYNVVDFHGGVAIRVDAQVLWAPSRSHADTVPSSVGTVDVVVVRTNPQLHRNAPTVRRTLTGAAARALANFVNSLPRAVPGAPASCPAYLVGEHWFDTLTFRSSGPTARLVDDMDGCATLTFAVDHRKPIQLNNPFHADNVIMKVLGLPAEYGR